MVGFTFVDTSLPVWAHGFWYAGDIEESWQEGRFHTKEDWGTRQSCESGAYLTTCFTISAETPDRLIGRKASKRSKSAYPT